jgi:hypothetical protein
MQPMTLETIAKERVISLASSDLSPTELDWWILPQCLSKVIEHEITKKALNYIRTDFSVVIESSDIIVLMGRGKCRGKGRPRKAKHLYAYKDAVYYETTLRVDYQWLDDMAIIEAQSVDQFTERRWMSRKLKDYYSDGSGRSKHSLKDDDSSTTSLYPLRTPSR